MDMEEKKLTADAAEQALPVQELPADIPAEVRQKLAEDLNEEATEDLKQDMREAEKEEANDEEVKANPEMLTKSRLLKLLIKKQYVKLREVTEEEQPADLAELLEELDENNRLVVFRLLKKEVATEAFAYMSDEARAGERHRGNESGRCRRPAGGYAGRRGEAGAGEILQADP